MSDLPELTRRVEALEAAQNDTAQTLRWVVAKLGRVSAVQDEHTLRLERIEGRIDGVDAGLRKVETDVHSLRTDMPAIVAGAMRDVLKERD
jgi:hypothetical protein